MPCDIVWSNMTLHDIDTVRCYGFVRSEKQPKGLRKGAAGPLLAVRRLGRYTKIAGWFSDRAVLHFWRFCCFAFWGGCAPSKSFTLWRHNADRMEPKMYYERHMGLTISTQAEDVLVVVTLASFVTFIHNRAFHLPCVGQRTHTWWSTPLQTTNITNTTP